MQSLPKLDARVPAWSRDGLVERSCPFCGSAGVPAFRRPDSLVVNSCGGCGAYFVSPAPTEAELTRFYSTYSERHQRLPNLSDRDLANDIMGSRPSDNLVMKELLSQGGVKGRPCLDIGFGRGLFLHLVRECGGVPHGIDLDPEAIRFARQRLKLADLDQGTIFDLPEDRRFDVIFMMDLVEHPLNILAILERARLLLNDSGRIVIWTPNASRVGQDDDHILFRVDLEHMQYLSCRTVQHLANRLDFEISHLEELGFPGLGDIDTLPPRRPADGHAPPLRRARQVIRELPGIRTAVRIRRALRPIDEPRLGTYHLFSILRKPGPAGSDS